MRNQSYNLQEDHLIRTYYPTATAEEIKRLFPNRSYNGIVCRAHVLGVKRLGKRRTTSDFHDSFYQRNPYASELLQLFFRYVEVAKKGIEETGRKPNVDHMIQTFRDLYGR